MKKFFKFLAYGFIFLLVLLLLLGYGYWGWRIKEWPLWFTAIPVFFLAGIGFMVFFLKKLMIRKNEKKFVQRIIHQEEDRLSDQAGTPADLQEKEAERQWKESVARLKKSHLRRYGNPLYVLPWYIIMGESRSGKTSAIKNADLSSALTDVSGATIVSGTRNCDWWFLEQAIVLDTAGRYTIPIEEDKDKKEWQLFLSLLARYRKKEPINGVIITVAGDALMTEDPVSLAGKAKSIRQRINQMMRILGARFPVYLLVTKMDLVAGFTDFCDHIPNERKEQVMGYANTDDQADGLTVLDQCMETLSGRIRRLRSVFIHKRINHFAVSFLNEFMALKPGLGAYIQSLFGKDIYQATPFFRGIYFSSACRKGAPESEFLQTAGISLTHDSHPDPNSGYFLKSFFNAVLPKDRNVFSPLSEFIMWRKTTLGLGLFSFVLIALALIGTLSFSYFNNARAIRNVDPSPFAALPASTGLSERISAMDRQKSEIDRLQVDNSGWVLPRLGLNHSRRLENRLKTDFVNDVRQHLIDPLDEKFFQAIQTMDASTPDADIVQRAAYAVQAIQILQKALTRTPFSQTDLYQKSLAQVAASLDPGLSGETVSGFTRVYPAYLSWCDTPRDHELRLEQFRKALADIAVNRDHFNWLLSQWVCATPDVGMNAFFTSAPIQSAHLPDIRVKGGFTRAGREEIQRFIQKIQESFADPEVFRKLETRFWDYYTREFYRAWFDFAAAFPAGGSWAGLFDQWTDLRTVMTLPQNPYFSLLKKMGDEFQTFQPGAETEPEWAGLIITISRIRQLAETEVKKEKGSFLAKLALKKEEITDSLEKSADSLDHPTEDDAKAEDLAYRLSLARIWNEYVDTLGALSSATYYNDRCFLMFSDYFKALSDPSKQQEPFYLAHEQILRIDALVKQKNSSPVLRNLIRGPFDYMIAYAMHQTVAHLQSRWEAVVLNAAFSIDMDRQNAVLFDKDSGLIWKFANEEASAFIDQNRSGFTARTVFDLQLPFNKAFLKLLTEGRYFPLQQQTEYPVSITTLPVSVNRGARISPHSTTLSLSCADEKTQLFNSNFPETRNFIWRPATCGQVLLEIRFEDAVLTKKYTGPRGFVQFLTEFRDGTRQFRVDDFPEYAGYLSKNDITDITLAYDMDGIEPILNLTSRRPAVPEIIFNHYKPPTGRFPIAQKRFDTEPPQPDVPAKPYAGFKDRYAVVMDALPMDADTTGSVKPVAGIFWMKCRDSVIRFENNNYPKSIAFDWEPEHCGKVVLTIQFPDMTLVREYTDFSEFLEDFNFQAKTFFPDDFPEQKVALLKKGISSITLSYLFKGDLPPAAARSGNTPAPSAGEPVVRTLKDRPADEALPMGRDWIRSRNENHFTIHLMMGVTPEAMADFVRTHGIRETTAVYESRSGSGTRYNLIMGSWPTLREAQEVLNGLPEAAGKHSPWVRRFVSIHKEMI